MIIDCIADLHGHFPKLKGGDLLIVAGDLTETEAQLDQFDDWLDSQKYRKKIFISGNHDNHLVNQKPKKHQIKLGGHEREKFEYLCDSGTEFEGLKIWGSPWTKKFIGMNPHCMAFSLENEDQLEEKWKLIPNDVDILITHSPPFGILDGILNQYDGSIFHVGSISLRNKVSHLKKAPKLWVWGHIHEAYGKDLSAGEKACKMVNASHVNERYKPVNKPVRIEL